VDATVRKSGADRYLTANKAADDGNTAETKFVIASGESFADGLTASALAGKLAGTLLLSASDSLTTSTLTQISKMGAEAANIWLVGGTSALSADVATTLTAAGHTVKRISGADRYATADAVAAEIKVQGGAGSAGGYVTCMLASGTSFADAASASGFAYASATPIFLTGDTLSAATSAQMKASGCQQVVVLGGTSAVSASAATDALAVSTVVVTPRLSGADRYATATAMATQFGTWTAGFKNSVVLVDGNNFPDALAASQYAAQQTSVILPVTTPMPSAVSTWLTSKNAAIADIAVVGGLTAVPAALVTAAKSAATIAKPTCVVTATDGVDNGTVTWTSSATMTDGAGAGGAEVLSSYTRTSSNGTVALAATATYTYTAATGVNKTTLTWAGGAVNKPGDVIQVVANVINGPSSTTNTGCTVTVAAETTIPTATIWAAATGARADSVYVDFNATANVTTLADAEITHVPANVGNTAAGIANCARIGTTQTMLCDNTGQALTAGDTIKIAANAVQGVTGATVKPQMAATSTIVVADAVLPYPTSASYTVTAVGGTSATLTPNSGAGDIKHTARAGGAMAGKAGNAVSVQHIETGIGAGGQACTYIAATKTIVVSADAATGAQTSLTGAALCNTDAAYSALFVASVAVAGAMDAHADVAAGVAPLTGGIDKMTVTVNFSEELGAVRQNEFSMTGFTCTNQAIKTVAATNNGMLTGSIQITCDTNETIIAGVDTVTVAANAGTVDRNANQVDQTGTKETVAIYPG